MAAFLGLLFMPVIFVSHSKGTQVYELLSDEWQYFVRRGSLERG